MVIPVMAPLLLIAVIVLEDTVVPAPEKLNVMPVTIPLAAVMLLIVFPVIVFTGPFVEEAPSPLFHPVTAVVPTTVTFEKLFPVSFICAPFTDKLCEVKNVTVPPDPSLLNVPAIELLVTLLIPVAVMLPEREMNVTLPVELMERFEKVLPLTVEVAEVAFPSEINVQAPDESTLCTIF